MNEEEQAWWLALLQQLSAARNDPTPVGHFARKLVAMTPNKQMEIASALVTLRRYFQQNERAAYVAALEGWPEPLSDAIRRLVGDESEPR